MAYFIAYSNGLWRSKFYRTFFSYGLIMIAPAAVSVLVLAKAQLAALANVAWSLNWLAGELDPRLLCMIFSFDISVKVTIHM